MSLPVYRMLFPNKTVQKKGTVFVASGRPAIAWPAILPKMEYKRMSPVKQFHNAYHVSKPFASAERSPIDHRRTTMEIPRRLHKRTRKDRSFACARKYKFILLYVYVQYMKSDSY